VDGTIRADKTYWSAYRKARRVQAKKYLGHDLTTGTLEAMALALENHLKAKLGIQDDQRLQTTRSGASKDAQREKIAYLLDQNEKKDRLIADLKQELERKDQLIEQLQKPQGKRSKLRLKRS
jgi:cell division protein FtsB